jgi:hypothetical protein
MLLCTPVAVAAVARLRATISDIAVVRMAATFAQCSSRVSHSSHSEWTARKDRGWERVLDVRMCQCAKHQTKKSGLKVHFVCKQGSQVTSHKSQVTSHKSQGRWPSTLQWLHSHLEAASPLCATRPPKAAPRYDWLALYRCQPVTRATAAKVLGGDLAVSINIQFQHWGRVQCGSVSTMAVDLPRGAVHEFKVHPLSSVIVSTHRLCVTAVSRFELPHALSL